MDLKKNLSVSKFLLPTSVAMMVVGASLLLLGFFPVFGFGKDFSESVGYLCVFLFFFGFIFFIVSLVDTSIARKREVAGGIEQQIVVSNKKSSTLVRVGVMLIIVVLCFMGLMFLALSGFRD